MTYTIPVDNADLVAFAVGLYLEQCPEASAFIENDGAGAFIDSDERTAQMSTDKQAWLILALSDERVRQKADELAALAREVVKEATGGQPEGYPWRDSSS